MTIRSKPKSDAKPLKSANDEAKAAAFIAGAPDGGKKRTPRGDVKSILLTLDAELVAALDAKAAALGINRTAFAALIFRRAVAGDFEVTL